VLLEVEAVGWVCWECKRYYDGVGKGLLVCGDCEVREERLRNYVGKLARAEEERISE
jgi:hypothetical protein